MATYKQIQEWVKKSYGFVPKTCWIAHVKHICGLPTARAWNRIDDERTNPCPEEKVGAVKAALRHFNMI